MDTAQNTTQQAPAKFKTTLYLTEENKSRLDLLNAKNRTRLINQAIAEKLESIEREALKEKLLNSLKTPPTHASKGTATEDVLHEIRHQEFRNLIKGDEH